MKNNIDEATAWGSAPNRPEEPGVGSIIKSRKKVPTEVTPATALNQRLRSKKGLPNDPSVYRTDKPKPQISKTPKGGTTFYSVAPETKQAPTPPTPRFTEKQLTIIRSLSAKRRKKLGIPDIHTGGPIKLTTNTGRPLKPGGKAAKERIGAARSAGSQTRIARRQREIIKEFIEKYRKSIL